MRGHFTRVFCAAHRLHDDPSPCQRIHGHNYEIEIMVTTDGVGSMIVPHSVIKNSVDYFDHRLILKVNDPLKLQIVEQREGYPSDRTHWDVGDWVRRVPLSPTTENLAQLFADEICNEAYEYGLANYFKVQTYVSVNVRLRETKSIMAEAECVRYVG